MDVHFGVTLLRYWRSGCCGCRLLLLVRAIGVPCIFPFLLFPCLTSLSFWFHPGPFYSISVIRFSLLFFDDPSLFSLFVGFPSLFCRVVLYFLL